MTESPLEQQAAPEKEGATSAFPRRKGMKVRDDEGAKCVVELLALIAARVPHEPSIRPPEEGMVSLGRRDRASYVWFLPCHPNRTPPAPVSGGGLCNHGIGIDRQYGQYEVRAWAHGSPGVFDVSFHTHEVTLEHLETAAGMVGIPLEPAYDHEHPCPGICVADVECCICFARESVVQHYVGPQEYSVSDPEGA